jgi:hypothetical protein
MSQQRLCNDTFNKLDLASSTSTFTGATSKQFHQQLATSERQHQHLLQRACIKTYKFHYPQPWDQQ